MLHAHQVYGHECGRSDRYSFGGKRLAHIVDHGIRVFYRLESWFSFDNDNSMLPRDSHIQAFNDLP